MTVDHNILLEVRAYRDRLTEEPALKPCCYTLNILYWMVNICEKYSTVFNMPIKNLNTEEINPKEKIV